MKKLRAALLFSLVVICALMACGLYHCVKRSPQEKLPVHAPLHTEIVEFCDDDASQQQQQQQWVEIVLFPGAYTSSGLWIALLKHWPRANGLNYRFIVPEMLGYGKSRWSTVASDYSMENQISLLKQCVERNVRNVAALHFVGVCMGGLFATNLAKHLKPLSLTLISTPFFRSVDEASDTGKSHHICYAKPWLIKRNYYLMRQRWLLNRLFKHMAAKKVPLVDNAHLFAMNGSIFAMEEGLIQIMAQYRPQRAANRVGEARIPTLCIRGAEDKLCPAEQQREMCLRLRPRSFVLTGSKCGHTILALHPKLILGKTNEFVLSNGARQP